MKNKIGVFDSGVGGLTVLKEIYKLYPKCDYIYIGDNKNLPYGEKTKEELYQYAKRIIEYFIKNNCNIVVIACNTTSANALDRLKHIFKNIIIIGVIDSTINKFLELNKKNVLVIGTTATINSNIYEKTINQKDNSINVYSLATPRLVSLIENEGNVEEIVNDYLKPYNDIDSIILGCTHYKLIERYISKNIAIINSSDGVVNELKKFITNDGLNTIKIYTTGNVDSFNKLCNLIINMNAEYLNL